MIPPSDHSLPSRGSTSSFSLSRTSLSTRRKPMKGIFQPWLLLLGTMFLLVLVPTDTRAFAPSGKQHRDKSTLTVDLSSTPNDDTTDALIPLEYTRRDLLRQSILASLGAVSLSVPSEAMADDVVPDGMTPTKTESGLKFVDLEQGGTAAGYISDETPKYGQLCVISYSAYMKLPGGKNTDKQKFDSTTGYVVKHGNGKLIAGLDEGLHTMKRGGLRRIIIPPKLGFVSSGVGPLPEYPWQRFKLNSLIDEMIAQRGGNLIYDVRLERFFDDEADQGYYEDLDILPEEKAEIEMRLMNVKKAKGQVDSPEVLDAVGEDISISDRPREKPIV